MPQYQWRSGSRTGGVDANAAGAELERIRDTYDGRIEADVVVDEAEPPTAPLHPIFEWDDRKAGIEHRLFQARTLMRNIRIVGATPDRTDPAFVHIRRVDDRPGYYQSTEVAVRNVDEWALALGELNAKFEQLSRALDDLRRVAGEAPKENAAAIVELAQRALTTTLRAINKLAA